MAEHRASIDIAAPPGIVFAHLTTAEGMVAWMGQHAELEPEPGGPFSVDVDGTPVRGWFVDVEPPHRVAMSWGIAGSDTHPPGSSTVTITLTPTDMGTHLELVHAGLPDAEAGGYRQGWTTYMARLGDVASLRAAPVLDP